MKRNKKNIQINIKSFIKFLAHISLFLVLVSGLWATAKAAEVDLVAPKEIVQNQTFTLEVVLGQPKEPVNAVSGSVIFDSSEFKLNKISDGASVVTLWLQKPETSKEGQVDFAGVTPGGLLSGKLFTLELVAQKNQELKINLQNIKLVSSDGSGKSFVGEPVSLKVNVSTGTPEIINKTELFVDNQPPLPFTIEVARTESIFNNQWFVVFNAVDVDSGIDYYEAAESFVESETGLVWEKTKSPYLLKDQTRKSYVFIRAIDREGNKTVATLKPLSEKNNGLDESIIYVIIGLIILVAVVILLRRKKQNVKTNK